MSRDGNRLKCLARPRRSPRAGMPLLTLSGTSSIPRHIATSCVEIHFWNSADMVFFEHFNGKRSPG